MMNNKGFIIELLAIIIIGFVTILFFAMWIYGHNLVNDALNTVGAEVDANTAGLNLTTAVHSTFGYVNTGLNELKTVAIAMIMGLILATLIMAYFSRQHPALIFMYLLVTIIAVIFSIPVSNAYETLLSDSVIGSTLSGFGASSWIFSHLPTVITLIGFMGIILMLSGIIKDREFGG